MQVIKAYYGNDWLDCFLSWTFCAPTSSTLSTSDFNAKLTAVEHVLHVLALHSQIIAETWWTSINSCQNMLECDPQDHKEKLQAHYRSNCQKGNDHLAWDVAISAATQLHCLAMRLSSDSQNLQKVGYDIVIFNGNVLGHAWHSWCKNGTNGKKMSCSLLVCHMQIFKLIHFRTMGLWKWITFFLIRTVQSGSERTQRGIAIPTIPLTKCHLFISLGKYPRNITPGYQLRVSRFDYTGLFFCEAMFFLPY